MPKNLCERGDGRAVYSRKMCRECFESAKGDGTLPPTRKGVPRQITDDVVESAVALAEGGATVTEASRSLGVKLASLYTAIDRSPAHKARVRVARAEQAERRASTRTVSPPAETKAVRRLPRETPMTYIDASGAKNVLNARLAGVLDVVRREAPVDYHPAWDQRLLGRLRDRGLVVLGETEAGWVVHGLTELGHEVLAKWEATRKPDIGEVDRSSE